MKKNNEENPLTPEIKYKDFGIRIVLSIISAHIMATYNEPEGFFQIVITESYIRGFIASFIMSLITINYIYYTTFKLDRLYNWLHDTFLRFIWQVILGFLLPAIIVFLLVTLFFWLYDIDIFKTEYLSQDYNLVLLMLLVVNLYYFGLYHFLIIKRRGIVQMEVTENLNSELTSISLLPEENTARYKETIIITTTLKTIPVNTDDIAYIFRLNDGVFIRLKFMKNLNESYQTNYSLKDFEQMLDPMKFFRINRQMIVSFQAVSAFRPETAKTLLLTLNPEMYPVKKDMPYEHQKLTVVSETKTPRFKIWMDR